MIGVSVVAVGISTFVFISFSWRRLLLLLLLPIILIYDIDRRVVPVIVHVLIVVVIIVVVGERRSLDGFGRQGANVDKATGPERLFDHLHTHFPRKDKRWCGWDNRLECRPKGVESRSRRLLLLPRRRLDWWYRLNWYCLSQRR
jgi:hypothetical protein